MEYIYFRVISNSIQESILVIREFLIMLQIAYFIKVYNYLILNNFVLMTFYLHSLLNIEKCKSENIRRYQHIYTYIFIFQYMTKTEKRNKIFLNLQGKTFLRRFLILRYFRGSLKMVHPVKCQKFLWDSLKATYMENFIIVLLFTDPIDFCFAKKFILITHRDIPLNTR